MNSLFNPDFDTAGTPFKSITNVGAVPGGDAFLLDNGETSILFDSGFGCCGDVLVKNIEKQLNGRSLNYILLSHSHYDHAPGSAWCAERWKNVVIIASAKTQSVFARPGARAVMRELDASASRLFGIKSDNDYFDNLKVDVALSDGDEITLGGLKCVMHLFPGHTNCSAGFLFTDSGLLLSSETLGVYAGGETVTPAFLVGFKTGVDSIKKALTMDIRHMLIPHFGMIHGDNCKKFLRLSLDCCELMWQTVTHGLDNGLNQDELIELLKEYFFTEEKRAIQPEEAFVLNAGYIIDIIRKEYSQNNL